MHEVRTDYKRIRRLEHLRLNALTISSQSESQKFLGPFMLIRINLSRFFSVSEALRFVQTKFITENPRSTFAVEGGINNMILNSLAMFGKVLKLSTTS